jgi:hypothetical protein
MMVVPTCLLNLNSRKTGRFYHIALEKCLKNQQRRANSRTKNQEPRTNVVCCVMCVVCCVLCVVCCVLCCMLCVVLYVFHNNDTVTLTKMTPHTTHHALKRTIQYLKSMTFWLVQYSLVTGVAKKEVFPSNR